jgi:hypothetical protein
VFGISREMMTRAIPCNVAGLGDDMSKVLTINRRIFTQDRKTGVE